MDMDQWAARLETKVDGMADDLASLRVEFATEITALKTQNKWSTKLYMALVGLLGAIVAALLGSCSTPAYADPLPISARAPVRVAVPEEVSVALDAMDYWNEAIGCRVFVAAKPGRGADLRVKKGPASMFFVGYYHDKERTVELFANTLDNEVMAYLVAIHEFGHVLGLRHVGDEDSVLNPYYVAQYDGTFDQFFKRPTSREFLHTLRAHYCE